MTPSDFKTPHRRFSPVAFWFWNSRLDPAELRRQVREMADKGVYGAFMHARAGLLTRYMSDEWWAAIEATCDEAEKAGFYAWIYDEYAWPSGLCGAANRNSHQPYSKVLEKGGESYFGKGLSCQRFSGPSDKLNLATAGLVAAVAFREEGGRIVDESLRLVKPDSEGNVDRLESDESLMAFHIYSMTYRVDYLNRAAIRTFIECTHEEYARRCGRWFGNVIPGIFFDEIHNDGQPLVWTERFPEEFRLRKQYKLLKFLPLLIQPGGRMTAKVRCDYFEVAAALYEEAFFRQIGEWCGAHGVRLTGHTEEYLISHPLQQGDYFRAMRHLQIPGSDHHGFRYSWPRAVAAWEQKPTSSLAHIYGKERCMAEAMGGAGWGLDLETAKHGANMLHVFGTTMVTLHGLHYSMDTHVGMDDWPNSWFHQNPYWKYFKQYADYISRCSSTLAGGRHVADVALYYPIGSLYADTENGRATQQGARTANTYGEVIDDLSAACVDFDVIDDHALISGSVGAGALQISGESYRVLILPPLTAISREVLAQIARFKQGGGLVVAVHRLPTASVEEGDEDAEIVQRVRELFGIEPKTLAEAKSIVGKCKGGTACAAGAAFAVPPSLDHRKAVVELLRRELDLDFIIRDGRKSLFYLHRSKDGHEIYFIVNASTERCTVPLSLRATGPVQRWVPENGNICPVAGARESDGRTEVDLELLPHEGTFLVFGKPSPACDGCWPLSAEGKELAALDSWTFIPSKTELKNKWTSQLDSSVLSLPVMRVHISSVDERESHGYHLANFDDTGWERVKLVESRPDGLVAGRYVSQWGAQWITYSKGARGHDNYAEVFFRKRLSLPEPPAKARLCATGASSYELFVNGAKVCSGDDPLKPQSTDVARELHPGVNVIAARVSLSPSAHPPGSMSYDPIRPDSLSSLLCEGEIECDGGRSEKIATDRTWLAALSAPEGWTDAGFDDSAWDPAWDRGRPPVPPWGDVPLDDRTTPYPLDVWYRAEVPHGAVSVSFPSVKGAAVFYLDGAEVKPSRAGEVPCRGALSLAVRVRCRGPKDGIASEPVLRFEPTPTKLLPWSQMGLDWFSGYGLYRTKVNLPSAAGRVVLDLGEVKHFAEAWVNGKLASVKVWRPFIVDITECLKPGENEIAIVTANLLANEMKWSVFDGVRCRAWNTYWHRENLERDVQQLRSGLMGPVRLTLRGLGCPSQGSTG